MPGPVITSADRTRPLPLSGGQQQMWILQQLDPASPAYLMTWVLRLSGPLDTESLRRAWERVTERHEILRTRYEPGTDGTAVAIIDPPGRFELRTIDLTGERPASREERARQVAEWERTRPFDLAAQHPVRVSVLVLGRERHLVVISIHHIACDPVSYQRIARELSAFYAEHAGGGPASLPQDTVQYADFAAWERDGQASGAQAQHLAYWRRELAGLTDLPLPLDRRRPARPDSRGGTVGIDLKPDRAGAILALAASRRVSPYLVLLAAYHLMLARISGSADVTVGIPVSARTVPQLDELVGYLVNTVVIRSRQDATRSFAELLAQLRERLLDALDHRAVPFAWVVDDVNPRRGSGANPLFRAGFDMDRAAGESPFQFPSIQTEEIGLSGSPPAKFDLTLHVEEMPGQQFSARLEFAAAVLDEATARAWACCYEALLDAALAGPAEPLARLGERLAGGSAARPERSEPAEPAGASGASAPAALIDRIYQAWRAVLPAAVIDVRDNFFDVGGDSLRAVALAGRLRAAGLDVSAASIFAHQSIEDLARACAAPGGAEASGRPGALDAPVRPAAVAPFELVSLADRVRLPRDVTDAYPLAAMQLGMIIELRSRPGINSYQDSTSYRIKDGAELDPAALTRALQLVVDRHEVLRTTFDLTSYSVPLQLVHRAAAITPRFHDHGALGPDGWLPALAEHAARERLSLLDLARAPLIRVSAHTAAGAAEWWITITECHPILEGWSFHTMLMEILTGYRELRAGRIPAGSEPAGFRYADYIAAEARARRSDEDRAYWRGVLDGRVNACVPSAWQDGQDTPRDRYQHMLDYRDLEADLRRLASRTRTSAKAVMLAAHLKVMSMMCGTEDFYTGLVCDARPEVAGADRVLGMYLNTVPFAMPCGARTWGELVRAVYDGLTELWPHRVFPLQVLQQESGSGGRLLEVFFNYLDFYQVEGELVDEEQVLNDNDNEFALHVFSISGVVRLNTTNHRLARAAAGRLAALYRTVLEQMSLGPHGDAGAACLPPAELALASARGLEARVTDARLRPLPAGVAGELCVAGTGLADTGLAGRFVPDPLGPGGSRLYRTGQLARITGDGTLELLGPILPDGPGGPLTELYRTRELLAAQPSVLDSFMLPRPGAPRGRQLIGYVRAVPGASLDPDGLRRALSQSRLAQQLIPDVLIQVDDWPLDERGAIDAERLPEPAGPAESPTCAQVPWDERFGSLLRGALDRAGFQGELTPDEPLSSSGLDSFGTVGLLLAVEAAYDITIPDDLQITEVVRTAGTLWGTIAALCLEPGRSR